MNQTRENQIQLRFFPNLKSVYNVINANQELVLYPIGNEGQMVMELFKYMGIIHRFCCIAIQKLMNDNEQRFLYRVPVIQLDHLPHLQNTAIFIVAMFLNNLCNLDLKMKY